MAASDAELVLRARGRDLEAFGQLYDRYARLVRAIAFDATRDLAQAQDLAQDVFLRAFQRLGELRDPQRFGRWVVGIARLAVKEWLRARARDRHQYNAIPLEEVGHDAAAQYDDRLESLLALMEDMPEMERLALHAFYLEGQNADQAAARVGLSRSGFYKLLDNARRRLAIRYRQREEHCR